MTNKTEARIYMGQIMAECDCANPMWCEANGKCRAEEDDAKDKYIAELEAKLAKAEAKLVDLEDRYGYIEEVWRDLYSDSIRQSVSIDSLRETFEKIRDTNTEKYLDVLEQFVEYMEKASIYKK